MKITLTLAEAENYIRLAQRLTIYDQVDIIVTSADLVVKSEADRANAGRVVSSAGHGTDEDYQHDTSSTWED